MDPTTSKEDILVALQTENGEQIALPISALPSDFVPGDNGQIIMVEGALEEQQQEVVVESEVITTTSSSPVTPRQKQKRKETLVTRPLNEEDVELKFQIIDEPSHLVQEVEVKRKPRKEYRTKKKVRLAMEKMLNNANNNNNNNNNINNSQIETPDPEQIEVEQPAEQPEPETQEMEPEPEGSGQSPRKDCDSQPKRDLPRRGARKDYRIFAGLQGKKKALNATGTALARGSGGDTKFA